MRNKTVLVVTSISAPNAVLRDLAVGARQAEMSFIVIGDSKSPRDFDLDGCSFFSIESQLQTGLRTAELCPQGHYARKNIGYLLAIEQGAGIIAETDDDNFPRGSFWSRRHRAQAVPELRGGGWVNAYAYFTDANIWSRGLPLDEVRRQPPAYETLRIAETDCPIQQGLADENPDVDAVYRLILPLPVRFRRDRRVALGAGSWCPFNSQNTSWWPDTYPLLYLPAYCSFRMTDIWRSFVAQRIAWANGWSVLFHEATVWQDRNDHSLMRDFRDEVPGYLHNRVIGETLETLQLSPGIDKLGDNLRICYEALVGLSLVDRNELVLLEAWLADLAALGFM